MPYAIPGSSGYSKEAAPSKNPRVKQEKNRLDYLSGVNELGPALQREEMEGWDSLLEESRCGIRR